MIQINHPSHSLEKVSAVFSSFIFQKPCEELSFGTAVVCHSSHLIGVNVLDFFTKF